MLSNTKPGINIFYIIGQDFGITSTFVSLTHWGRDNLAGKSQTTFSNAFSLMKTIEFGF